MTNAQIIFFIALFSKLLLHAGSVEYRWMNGKQRAGSEIFLSAILAVMYYSLEFSFRYFGL